ncbi:uncharacterized protein LOC143629297 [Bidens hawaiensis]|uniref:uncharacterized protein LOC143629297 n=1 Tax=Bidens hawaiensis TaxID=980011 RepID=UPI00404B0E43
MWFDGIVKKDLVLYVVTKDILCGRRRGRLEGKYSASPLYCGTFANGFLYWIVEEVLDRRIRAILIALDVKEMVISKILPLPRNFNLRDSLCTLNGRLHFLYKSLMAHELWVMNDDGMEKSWSKVLTLNINNALSGFHIPLSIIDTGKIVIMNGHENERQIIIYDIIKDSQEIYEVQARYLNRIWKLQAMEYVESLISPSHLFSTW